MPLGVLEKLALHARQRPDAVAVTTAAPVSSSHSSLTFGELHESVRRFAITLRSKASAGDVVVLCLPNQPQFVVAFLGVLASNLAVFPVHPNLRPIELASAAKRSRARLFIGASTLFDSLADLKLQFVDIDRAVRFGEGGTLASSLSSLNQAALLLQSSGTTGPPKIVYRSGRSLDAVASNVVESTGLSHTDRVLATMPLCHSYGVENGLLAPVLAGASIHLSDGFDPALMARQFAEGGITVFPGVPFMFQILAEWSGTIAMPALRHAYSAGGPLPVQIAERFLARYGRRIGQLYGSTEVGSVTFGDPRDSSFNAAGVGRAMRDVAILILDPDRPDAAHPLPPGCAGLVAIAAPSMLDRYVDDESPALANGYFHTGDLGYIDVSGNLVITGRLKLQIDVGGLKVNPLEVEQVLAQHPAVKESVVVAAPATHTVDRLKAIITLQNGVNGFGIEELRQFARARLAPYKVPRLFEIRDALPKSPSGKILREALRCD